MPASRRRALPSRRGGSAAGAADPRPRLVRCRVVTVTAAAADGARLAPPPPAAVAQPGLPRTSARHKSPCTHV